MIQRIQTLFFLMVSFLMSLIFFFPMATFQANEGMAVLTSGGILKADSCEFVVWPLMAILSVMIILPLVTIGLYKKRMLQIRLTVFSALLELLSIGLVAYEVRQIAATLPAITYTYNWYLLSVVAVALILNFLAIKRIGRDEMLVRSLNSNRIR